MIFLGADVTHPPSGDIKKPSIAALVGSMDAHPSRYAATVRVQPYDADIIQDFSSMIRYDLYLKIILIILMKILNFYFREILLMFYKSTGGFKPHRIILYRAGLPEPLFFRVCFVLLLILKKLTFFVFHVSLRNVLHDSIFKFCFKIYFN